MNLAIQEAQARRDHGMAISEIKANNDSPEWSSKAHSALILFLLLCDKSDRGKKFLVEDVREWVESNGLIKPASNSRAWGSVIRRCARDGMIRQDGYLPAKSSNMSPKCAWVCNL